MSPESFSLLLSVSVLSTVVAAMIGLLIRGKLGERMSFGLLVFAMGVGVFVGGAVAIGATAPVAIVMPSVFQTFLFGMVFGLDRLSGIFFALSSFIIGLSALFAAFYLEKYAYLYNLRLVAFLTCLLAFGIFGVLLSTNTIGLMLFLQVTGLATFFLIIADGTLGARDAGIRFFIMFEMSSAAVVAGLFLLANGAEELLADFTTLATSATLLSPELILLSAGLLFSGLGARAGIAPFHGWLAESYARAPAHVSAIISTINVSVAIYGFLRVVLFTVAHFPVWFGYVVVVIGLASAIMGVLSAAVESNAKKLLAFDTMRYTGICVALLGIVLVSREAGLIGVAQAALYAVLLLTLTHAVVKSGLYLITGLISYEVHSESLEAMGGLARRMPFLSVIACTLTLLATTLPPSGFFVSEWIITEMALFSFASAGYVLQSTYIISLVVFFFVSGLALFSYVKFFATAFLARARSLGAENAKEPKRELLLSPILLTIASVFVGLFSPEILGALGAVNVVAPSEIPFYEIAIGDRTLIPLVVISALVVTVLITYLLRRMLTRTSFERMQEPWNGGYTPTSRMAYTSTAFSSSIRYFFSFLLKTRSRKALTVTPLLTTNPWFTAKSFEMNLEPAWEWLIFRPLERLLQLPQNFMKKLQYGNVQIYVAMILLTLAVSIIVAL